MLRPLPSGPAATSPAAGTLLDAPLSLVAGPPGSYAAESLAAILEAEGRWQQCVWLRSGARGAAALTGELVDACGHRWDHAPDDAAATLHAVIARAPRGAVLVIEWSRRVTPAVSRLFAELSPAFAAHGLSAILVGRHRSDRLLLSGTAVMVPAADLTVRGAAPAGLARSSDDRLSRVTDGRPALRRDVIDAVEAWQTRRIDAAIAGATTWRSLVDTVTSTLVTHATADQRGALELCVATGYWYPQAVVGDLDVASLRPWVIALERQWGWLRPEWRRTLARHLRATRTRRWVPSAAQPPRSGGVRAPDEDAIVTLEARMLGTFELRVDGVGIAVAPGHRGYAVLRYLLSRQGHTAARDEILEQFWPDVDEKVARNRLQVAISGVRRALRDISQVPIIEYRDGAYGIAPTVAVTVDVDRFEGAMASARAAQDADRPQDALAAYRTAVRAYRGDFAADTPYETWSLLPREGLRLRYIDALDHLSRLQVAAGHVEECIATAHRLVDVDPSREDAHRLLMRCYAGQGRTHQALRQYDLCVRALRATIDAEPSLATQRLREAVLAGTVAPA